MALLSNLPIMELILAAEEKHGIDVNMVIEARPKEGFDYSTKASDSDEDPDANVEDTDVEWYVEFKDIKKVLNSFEEVKKFFLEEMGDNNLNLVIPVSSTQVSQEEES